MKNKFLYNFIKCGFLGWCLECSWTGLLSIISKDKLLSCTTSVWMFPIYGLAVFISPISKKIQHKNILIRGGLYTICIFSAEYVFGSILRKIEACPWDYSKERFNYKGLIRYDFVLVWFIVGLLYEKFLSINSDFASLVSTNSDSNNLDSIRS